MKVELTERGQHSFQEVLVFLLEEQEVAPEIVLRTEKEIRQETSKLSDSPNIGQPETDLSQRWGREYRSFLVKRRYRLVYFVDRSEGVIYITDVFDTPQDPLKMQG